MRKVLSIVGARPQFIKAAMVSRALRAQAGLAERLVHTGQHYDANMSDVFFAELAIPQPDVHLGIGSGPHGQQTGRMLEQLEATIQREAPDWVLVFGDTNSTLAGALAAAKLRVPVAHVEAGLRSFNRAMPEEVNRVVADHLSALLFAPTRAAVANLEREGIARERIRLCGDVMLDAALHFAERAARESRVLSQLGVRSKEFALATIHRAENTDSPERLAAICTGLATLAARVPVIFPIHPRTRKALPAGVLGDGVRVIDPVGFLDMTQLEKNARLVVTDSGGVQKEAFFQGTPCATLREETEWVELVEAGWNTLVPPRGAREVGEGLLRILQAPPPARREPLYGDGRAAAAIARALAA